MLNVLLNNETEEDEDIEDETVCELEYVVGEADVVDKDETVVGIMGLVDVEEDVITEDNALLSIEKLLEVVVVDGVELRVVLVEGVTSEENVEEALLEGVVVNVAEVVELDPAACVELDIVVMLLADVVLSRAVDDEKP